MATGVVRADLNEPPEDDAGARPADKSCYVREENGEVRFYLDGPLHDGELPYLQSRPIVGGDGRLVVDRKSTRLNSSHLKLSRMPSSA